MAERTTELTPLAKIILAGIAGAFVIGGAVFGGAALLSGDRDTQLVILKADTSDYKKQPADKGGLKINSIDSPAMSLLDKAEKLEDGVEILRPPVSEPEPPPIDVKVEEPASETPQDTAESTSDTADAPAPSQTAPKAVVEVIKPAQDEPAETVTAAEPEVITETTSEEPQSSDDVKADDVKAEDEITAAVNNLPQKRPNTPKIVATTDVNSPSYVVQFAAFKNETRARNTAALLSTKHKSRLDGMTLGYMRWGDYWRVVAEPMPRADANAFCSKFRSVGQDCIIKLMENPNG